MNPVFWIVAAAVVVVLAALAWWSSGRKRLGVDAERARQSLAKSQSDALDRSNRPAGTGPIGPGSIS